MSQFRRRQFLLLAGALLAAPLSHAQKLEGVRVIGYLTPSAKPSLRDEVFQRGMRELGWIEGKNIRIEYRRAANSTERLSVMAEELVRLKVDLIVALSTPAVQAAKNATQTIPVVSISADPVGNRFVASLARPGGNITGVSMMMHQLTGKRLEMLKEIFPKLSRVAFLAYGSDPSHTIFLKEARDAGVSLRIQVQPVVVNGAEDFESAFSVMKKEKANALIIQPLFINMLGAGPQLVALAAKNRIPIASDGDGFADAGGLMFYGPDSLAIYKRIAVYVDRVLKGTKPADLPIEQPQTFQLVINLNTAKALGITIPRTVLLRADRVIE